VDLKRLDLTGRKGVTVTVDLANVNPSKSFYITAKDPVKGTIFYERFVNKNQVVFNMPKHTDQIDLGVIGAPTVTGYQVGELDRVKIPFEMVSEVHRPFKIGDIKIRQNTDMFSPARFHTKMPLIEENPIRMAKYSHPVQVFIRYHELAHYYTNKETKADLYALIMFLNDGYNMSSAAWALSNVLGRTKENIDRLQAFRPILNFINKEYYA